MSDDALSTATILCSILGWVFLLLRWFEGGNVANLREAQKIAGPDSQYAGLIERHLTMATGNRTFFLVLGVLFLVLALVALAIEIL